MAEQDYLGNKIRELSADWRAMRTMILIAASILVLATACSALTGTPTPRPTYTPYPTYTPVPPLPHLGTNNRPTPVAFSQADTAGVPLLELGTNSALPTPTVSPETFHKMGEGQMFFGEVLAELEQAEQALDEGRYQDALEGFLEAQRLHGEPSRVLQNWVGNSYSALGQHDQAIQHYTNAIDIRDNAYHRIPRAIEYANNGRCEEAMPDAETALAMAPYSEPGYHTGAEAHWILAACLPDEQAQAHTEQALAIAQAHGYTEEEIDLSSEAVDRWRLFKTVSQTKMEKHHHQWVIGTAAASELIKANPALAGTQSANEGNRQQYSCAIYLDGTQVPRINLAFGKDLTYQIVINQFGERQGEINAITTVAGTAVPVEWSTWVTKADFIRLRDEDAVRLVQSINELNAEEFTLELKDDPELSATYNVSNLTTALEENKMRCFQSPEPEDEATTFKQYSSAPEMTIDPSRKYNATITTNQGEMEIALYPSEAPMAVNNFVFLARDGFYNGAPFHRIIQGFMIQTGDPTGTGVGGPGYRFADEPVSRSYTKGIVAMANGGPNTNGSQFFIVHADDAGLPPSYTIFGEVILGLNTLDTIASTPVRKGRSGEISVPTKNVVIERIQIQEAD